MERFWYDIRIALRSLQSNLSFTIVALLTIVLTIGGIATVFMLVHSVLLRPLPYPDSGRLVAIETRTPRGFGASVSIPDFLDFRKESRSFESMAYRPAFATTLDPQTNPLTIADMNVTPEIFPMLNIQMALGRPLLRDDAKAENPEVAVISYDLWQTRLGGKPDVIGKTIQTVRVNYTVVGVTAPGQNVPRNPGAQFMIWTIAREPCGSDRRFGNHSVLARLRDGVSAEAADAEVKNIASRLAAQYPDTNKDRVASATLLLDRIVGDSSQILWIFFGAVACVLLIGVANLISLQIVRNAARKREICVRAALGANRIRLVWQLLVETLLLSSAGGIAGSALAWVGTKAVVAMMPSGFPRSAEVSLDASVIAFTFGVSLVVGIVFGAIPAWRASRPDLNAGISEGTRSATMSIRRSRLQSSLIALETAIALVLLVGAGLLANSFGRLIKEGAGMQEERLWAVKLRLPLRYGIGNKQMPFWNDVLQAVRALPQVETAAIMVNSSTPLSGGDMLRGGIMAEGKSLPPEDRLSLSQRRVSDGYFKTIGVPIIKGRPILESDTAASEAVAVINETAAARLFPGEDPIGKRFTGGRTLTTVIGVIPDNKIVRLDAEVTPQMYQSYLQDVTPSMNSVIMLRAKPETGGIPDAVLNVISNLEKEATVDVSTMDQVRWNLLATERFRPTILLIFATCAGFLALVGIFGIVSYNVVQRNREIGLRVALGAGYPNIVGLMIRHAMIPALIGFAIGTVAAIGVTRLLRSYLFGIQPTDPVTFGISVALLAVAAFAAGLLPALRARRVDPIAALRYE